MSSRFPFALYDVGLILSIPFLLPYYGLRAVNQGKYISSFKERFGYLPEQIIDASCDGPTIWIHGVSVGEILAARPLVSELYSAIPSAQILISTTTQTGQEQARKQLSWVSGHFYFPLDFRFVTEKVIEKINPSIVIILETEIWPNFVRSCSDRNIPIVLVNGRISDQSFQRYYKIRNWMGDLLSRFTLLLMQSSDDANRISQLGASSKIVKVMGNLKYDLPDQSSVQDVIANELREQFNFSIEKPLLIAGSTMEGEEEILLEVFKKLKREINQLRMLIAPRHPHRFEKVYKLMKQSGFEVSRRSNTIAVNKTPLILLDSIGELAAAYRFSNVVFVGGSLVRSGGHNILEPAAAACSIVTGPYMENFRAIVDLFNRAGAMWQAPVTTSQNEIVQILTDKFRELLFAKNSNQMGVTALRLFNSERGATRRAFDEICTIL